MSEQVCILYNNATAYLKEDGDHQYCIWKAK